MEIWDGYFRDGSLANKDLVRGEAKARYTISKRTA